MSAPTHPTTQYPSTHFVESCGTILFRHLSTSSTTTSPAGEICLLRSRRTHRTHQAQPHTDSIWLLPKGRRNIHEPRLSAALRETREETGFACKPLPVDLRSRVTPWDEGLQSAENVTADVPRAWRDVEGEAFMVSVRELPPLQEEGEEESGESGGRRRGGNVKLIYWFLAEVDEEGEMGTGEEDLFEEVRFFPLEEVVERATFECDREILRAAVRIWAETVARRERREDGEGMDGKRD